MISLPSATWRPKPRGAADAQRQREREVVDARTRQRRCRRDPRRRGGAAGSGCAAASVGPSFARQQAVAPDVPPGASTRSSRARTRLRPRRRAAVRGRDRAGRRAAERRGERHRRQTRRRAHVLMALRCVGTAPTGSLSIGYRLASARVLEFRILGPLEVLRRRPAGPARRAEAARGARDPAPEREPRRLGRAARRRPLRRRPAGHRRHAGAAAGLRAAQAPRRGRDRDALTRLRRPRRARAGSTSTASSAGRSEGGAGARRGDAQAASELFSSARSSSGAAHRSPTSRTSRSRRPRSRDSTSCGSAALEQRFDAELALGRHAALLAELEALVWDHPLRERLRGQLMLALYRAGRQAEALEVYRRTRESLVDEFGHRAVEGAARARAADPRAGPGARPAAARRRRRRVGAHAARRARPRDDRLDALLVARRSRSRSCPAGALIIARLVARRARGRAGGGRGVNARAASLEVPVRTAAFTSLEPARDVVRLATNYDVELVLLDAPPGSTPERAERSAAIASTRPPTRRARRCAARLAARRRHLRAVRRRARTTGRRSSSAPGSRRRSGAAAARRHARRSAPRPRDASRLLADASLAVAARRRRRGRARARRADRGRCSSRRSRRRRIVVAGFPSRWRAEGLGATRPLADPRRANRPCCSCTAARGRAGSRRARQLDALLLVARALRRREAERLDEAL